MHSYWCVHQGALQGAYLAMASSRSLMALWSCSLGSRISDMVFIRWFSSRREQVSTESSATCRPQREEVRGRRGGGLSVCVCVCVPEWAWPPDCAAAAAPPRCCGSSPAAPPSAPSAPPPASSPAPPGPPRRCAASPAAHTHTHTKFEIQRCVGLVM